MAPQGQGISLESRVKLELCIKHLHGWLQQQLVPNWILIAEQPHLQKTCVVTDVKELDAAHITVPVHPSANHDA
jgi:hypothetical protein